MPGQVSHTKHLRCGNPDQAGMPPRATPAPECPDRLRQARCFADRGRLDEAARLCVEHLAASPTDAEAQYLLGVIRQSGGDDGAAEEAFRRAVFLDGEHEGALVHLALLAERRGDRDAAENWRQRYERQRRQAATATRDSA